MYRHVRKRFASRSHFSSGRRVLSLLPAVVATVGEDCRDRQSRVRERDEHFHGAPRTRGPAGEPPGKGITARRPTSPPSRRLCPPIGVPVADCEKASERSVWWHRDLQNFAQTAHDRRVGTSMVRRLSRDWRVIVHAMTDLFAETEPTGRWAAASRGDLHRRGVPEPERPRQLCRPSQRTAPQRVARGSPSTTNNRMELTAVIEALTALTGPSRVELFTDSEYVRKGHEWIHTWKRG